MRSFSRFLGATSLAALLAACSGNGTTPTSLANGSITQSSITPMAAVSALTPAERGWPRSGPSVRACANPGAGEMQCRAWVRTDIAGKPGSGSPSGYFPHDLQTAYNLTTASASGGSGATVAIVDAYDDPNAESDLGVYRSQFGLSPCTTANGCFTKVKLGKRANTGWAEEESLDVDMVSAICPNCHIMLVEAASASTSNLTTAEDYALSHANYASNSWSGNETSASSTDSHYQVSGKVVTAATGDSGYNATAQWPAILPGVVGVGGTSLTSVSPRVESAWSGAGSGCSKIYAKPSYQSTVSTGCSMRAQADASAVADPNTGVAVYDTFHTSGWLVFGGTSVATPIIASVYALSGNTNTLTYLYGHASSLNDVASGSNGTCGAPLCTSGSGWDGPTGEGSPNGTGAF